MKSLQNQKVDFIVNPLSPTDTCISWENTMEVFQKINGAMEHIL